MPLMEGCTIEEMYLLLEQMGMSTDWLHQSEATFEQVCGLYLGFLDLQLTLMAVRDRIR